MHLRLEHNSIDKDAVQPRIMFALFFCPRSCCLCHNILSEGELVHARLLWISFQLSDESLGHLAEITECAIIRIKTCSRLLCTHRQHDNLAITVHSDCLTALRSFSQPRAVSWSQLWNLGHSTLPISACEQEYSSRRRVSSSSIIRTERFAELLTSRMARGVSPQGDQVALRHSPENPVFCSLDLYKRLNALPPELFDLILRYSWQSCVFTPAIILQKAIYLNLPSPDSVSLVCLDDPVVLGFTNYENRSYVSQVRSDRRENYRMGNIHEIQLLVDEMGILQIYFIFDRSNRPREGNLSKEAMCRTLRAKDNRPIHQIRLIRDVCIFLSSHSFLLTL